MKFSSLLSPLLIGATNFHPSLKTIIVVSVSGTAMAQRLDDLKSGNRQEKWKPSVTFTSLDVSFQNERVIHDINGDGYCDLWTSLFNLSAIPLSPNQDVDRDGLSTYEEMLLWRNPLLAEHLPRIRSTGELQAEALQVEEAKLERFREETQKNLAFIQLATRNLEHARLKDLQIRPRVNERQQELTSLSHLLAQKSDRILKLARARLSENARGRIGSLRGLDSRGHPVFIQTYNRDAGTAIQADKLWAGGSSPLPDIEGVGVPPIGIWDLGIVRLDHSQLFGRVTLGETMANLYVETGISVLENNFANHPTGVAGTLAASGVGEPTRKGIAPSVNIKSYHLVNDFSEMGAGAKSGMLFSNHSYGNFAGWFGESTWYGPYDLAGEDPEFGSYTEDSKTLDALAYLAPHYLSIWASGNEVAGDGGAVHDLDVYVDSDGDGLYDEIDPLGLEHPMNSGTPLPGADFIPDTEMDYFRGPGFDTIVSTGCAKNNLTVGNIHDVMGSNEAILPVVSPSDPAIYLTSSRGPTDDGRIKPDLVANGTTIDTLDASSSTGTINNRNGTSYSAPVVTGALALLQQLNQDLGGPLLLSSSWKALLCNTAVDGINLPAYLGTAATTTSLEGPDYFYGWGACNALAAAELLYQNIQSGSRSAHLCEHLLVDGSTIEIPICHDGIADEIKVMICWTDPPYQTSTIAGLGGDVTNPEVGPADSDHVATPPVQRLMNDLDLRVISPDGQTTHLPWVLDPADDPANPLKKATVGDNFRDNIEQVVISNPVPGDYTLQITHKGSLKSLQLITSSDPNTVLPNESEFQLLSGQSQAVSICVLGNKDPSPLYPQLGKPIFIGGGLYFEVKGHLGVHYKMETSTDLETWTEVPNLTIEVQTFPQSLGPIPHHPANPKTFYRLKPIPAAQ